MSTASARRRRRRASARPAAGSSIPRTCCPRPRCRLPKRPSAKARQPASAAVPILTKAIAQMETEDGWVGLGVVGQRLANIASDFDPRTYGYRKLSDLVRQTGAFEMDQPDGRAVRIRAKPRTSGTRAGARPRRRNAPRNSAVASHGIRRLGDFASLLLSPPAPKPNGRRGPTPVPLDRKAPSIGKQTRSRGCPPRP